MAKWNGWTITSTPETGTVMATKAHESARNGILVVTAKKARDADFGLAERAVKRDCLYEDLRLAPEEDRAGIEKQIEVVKADLKEYRAAGADARRAAVENGE